MAFDPIAHGRKLEDLGFLSVDAIFDRKAKRIVFKRFVYDPLRIQQRRAEDVEYEALMARQRATAGQSGR
jgi:hypothetical protein